MSNFTPNENFKYYMYFIEERMNIFWEKYYGLPKPYTDDKIFQNFKFTNVYRVLDRSSQFLLSDVIYNGKNYTDREMFWRIMIYKHFNLPLTWKLLIQEFGDIDSDISLKNISDFLVNYQKNNENFTPYSNAYMLTAAFLKGGEKTRYFHLKNLGWKKYQYYFYVFENEIDENKINLILGSKSFQELFENISTLTSFANFISYQIAQDLNYTNFVNLDENSFCSAGGGTERGVERCFEIKGKPDYNEIVKWVHSNFNELCEQYKIDFKSLPNHLPTVPDLSNCFCETDKYLRGLGIETEGKEIEGKRIKNSFTESTDKIKFIFPPKWNVKI